MEISNLLSNQPRSSKSSPEVAKHSARRPKLVGSNNGLASYKTNLKENFKVIKAQGSLQTNKYAHQSTMDVMNPVSPTTLKQSATTPPKKVSFELLLDETTKTRARIPMRVVINPHDTTDSIIATVKNWYGIYEGHGVRFEDQQGNALIARYENVVHEMIIYVRTVTGHLYSSSAPAHAQHHSFATPEQRPSGLGEPFHMLPPHPTLEHSQTPTRPTALLPRKRSASPPGNNRGRSASQQKRGSRSELRSRNSSSHGSHHDDTVHGSSDSDGGHSSVTGSRKARSEQFVSADISLENVLQDGRRNRPKFDSSELPLFVPPQVPLATSQSSMSPQRRSGGVAAPSPFALPSQKLFHHNLQPLPSPHGSYEEGYIAKEYRRTGKSIPSAPQHGHRLRDRGNAQFASQRSVGNPAQAILPTPDPTIASCISDEDVARQLIALGDASNFSLGRTSASTLDDAFSGVADVASSTGATSDSEEYGNQENDIPMQGPARRDSIFGGLGRGYPQHKDIKSEDLDSGDDEPKSKKIKAKTFDGSEIKSRHRPAAGKPGQATKNRANTLPKVTKSVGHTGLMKAPSAPAGSPASKSPTSMLNFHHHLAADEEDLSSKPRCQRCRKSKKGCDRQRPCQRCKDAGIGVDGCVSEDEGNGRKGRYGRHMGVIVKKPDEEVADGSKSAQLPSPTVVESSADKSRKRKR